MGFRGKVEKLCLTRGITISNEDKDRRIAYVFLSVNRVSIFFIEEKNNLDKLPTIEWNKTLENSVPHLVNQRDDNKEAKNSSNFRVFIYVEM